jgi:hypothetical protein
VTQLSFLTEMARINSNRFESLPVEEDQEEAPAKKTNHQVTPEFPAAANAPAEVASIGQPALPVAQDVIVRINGKRPPPPPARGKKDRPPGKKDGIIVPRANVWNKQPARSGPSPSSNDQVPVPKAVPIKPRPDVVLVKIEKPVRPSADTDFLNLLKAEAPDLLALVEKESALSDRASYTVEMVCSPDPTWGTSDRGPDLESYIVEKGLLQALSVLAGADTDHNITLEPIRSLTVDGQTRKKFFYQLACTSEAGLKAIITHAKSLAWKGYTISYYQPKDSRFGFRFQYSISGLPSPFKDYSVIDWLEVIVSQGWDEQSITYICMGVISDPGEMSRKTGMLDIYIKPEACINHGCDAALHNAGTEQECVGKVIDYPPAQILLGRNPSEESQELIASGLCKGQYYTANSAVRPPQGPYNTLLERQVGTYLPHSEFGKVWMRKTLKMGSCGACWGPKHPSRELCMYKGMCRECLVVLKDLPGGGFHHACRSLVISENKRDKYTERNAKKRRSDSYDPGTPAHPEMAVYKPSVRLDQRQKVLETLKLKQLHRKAAAERAAADAARLITEAALIKEAAELAEYEEFLQEVQLDEEPVLSEEERAAQDIEIANMDIEEINAPVVDDDDL